MDAYVYIGCGDKYVEEAICLKKTICFYDKERHHILVSDKEAIDKYKNDFNLVINITEYNLIKNESNSHNKYCVIARILTPTVIPEIYINFMMLDTDILCMYDPQWVWATFKAQNRPFSCVKGRDGSKWHWGFIDEINILNSSNIKPMHGGVVFFNRINMNSFHEFNSHCMFALLNYDKLGFKRNFRNGSMTDEIIFSYAMDKMDYCGLDYIEYPVVSFCLTSNIELPPYVITWNNFDLQKTILPCVFNHFTGLHEFNYVQKLYNDWKQKLVTETY
jgi:hypothetical protein